WIGNYAPGRFVEAADELRSLPGAEGLAVLAALLPTEREAVLREAHLDEAARESLQRLSAALGNADDPRSPASALREMFPHAAAFADENDARASFGQGLTAQERRDFAAAEDWYRRSLAVAERLGDEHEVARACHHLGMVMQERRDFAAAEELYRRSLA